VKIVNLAQKGVVSTPTEVYVKAVILLTDIHSNFGTYCNCSGSKTIEVFFP